MWGGTCPCLLFLLSTHRLLCSSSFCPLTCPPPQPSISLSSLALFSEIEGPLGLLVSMTLLVLAMGLGVPETKVGHEHVQGPSCLAFFVALCLPAYASIPVLMGGVAAPGRWCHLSWAATCFASF